MKLIAALVQGSYGVKAFCGLNASLPERLAGFTELALLSLIVLLV